MKIENEILQFHESSPFHQLKLTDLQSQYLADLRAQNSVRSLAESYLSRGWLVNFQVLYDLIEVLVRHNWVLNSSLKNYFSTKMSTSARTSAPTVAITRPRALGSSGGAAGLHLPSENELLHFPFFRSLDAEMARYLLSQGRVVSYRAESLICKAGDLSRDLFVLLRGEAGVYRPKGSSNQFIAVLDETSVFGEAGFLLGQPRSADVVTLKACEILAIPYQATFLEKSLNQEKAQKLQQRFWVQHAFVRSDFFSGIPTDCLDALTFVGQIVDIPEDQLLFSEGETGQTAFVVIQGSLGVFQKSVKINTLTQGDFLGEISLMANQGFRTATVKAERPTKLLKITRTDFYRLLAQNLSLGKELQILADQRLENDRQRSKKPQH